MTRARLVAWGFTEDERLGQPGEEEETSGESAEGDESDDDRIIKMPEVQARIQRAGEEEKEEMIRSLEAIIGLYDSLLAGQRAALV